jgi:hypothetical protein
MKQTVLLLTLTGLLTIGLINSGKAQQPPNIKDPNLHFAQFKFLLAAGQSKVLPLPRKDCPVHLEVSITGIVENGNPTRPILLGGSVVIDSRTGAGKTKSFFSTARIDCSFNDEPPVGTFDCGVSDAEDLLARLILDPQTSNVRLALEANRGAEFNDLAICVNMFF